MRPAGAGTCGMTDRVSIAIIHGNDGSDVRVGKLCRSFVKMGFDVHFIGWDRRPDESKHIDLSTAAQHVMRHGTAHGKSSAFGHLRYVRHVLSVLSRVRPDVVYAVNEENAFFALFGKRLLYRGLICDVFDSLVDRHSHRPWWIRVLLMAVAFSTRSGADRLIATDAARHARFGRFRDKCVVVENYPERVDAAIAQQMPQGPVKVWVGGTLTETRGLRQVLDAVASLDNVSILSAGWPYDDFAATRFVTDPKVDFRGITTALEALQLAASCDAVLAYYAPTSTNNLYASPNKIYDALCIGRPVIINEEIHVATFVRDQALGMLCAYDDVACLRAVIAGLRGRRDSLAAFADRTRGLFEARYNWERVEPTLRDLVVSVAGRGGA